MGGDDPASRVMNKPRLKSGSKGVGNKYRIGFVCSETIYCGDGLGDWWRDEIIASLSISLGMRYCVLGMRNSLYTYLDT